MVEHPRLCQGIIVKTVAEVAKAAADLLEKEGWVQGKHRYWDGSPCDGHILGRCVLAAFADVTPGGDKIFSKTRSAFGNYLGVRNIAHWNDAEERTKEEVVTALRDSAWHGE